MKMKGFCGAAKAPEGVKTVILEHQSSGMCFFWNLVWCSWNSKWSRWVDHEAVILFGHDGEIINNRQPIFTRAHGNRVQNSKSVAVFLFRWKVSEIRGNTCKLQKFLRKNNLRIITDWNRISVFIRQPYSFNKASHGVHTYNFLQEFTAQFRI